MQRPIRSVIVVLLSAVGFAQASVAEDLPGDAQKIVDSFDKAAAAVRERAEAELNALRKTAVQQLQPIQDRYTRAAKLDEALAVREAIRAVRGVKADPGVFSPTVEDAGRTLYFEVVGDPTGSVWGTKVYCAGSALSAAAVHVGVLRAKEKGVVKVTVLPGADSYQGSAQNGVTSSDYGPYKPAFTIERMP